MLQQGPTNPLFLHNDHVLAKMQELGYAELKSLADAGEPYALVSIGARLEQGEEGMERAGESIDYYRRAAEKGLALAQTLMGERYRDGEFVAVDHEEAKNWFRQAALQGAAPALYQLGLYALEDGMVSNALELLYSAAENGLVAAQWQLGNLFEFHEGIGPDYAQAFKWYSVASNESSEAKFKVAMMLRGGLGCEKDEAAALVLVRELAEEAHVDGAFMYGVMHWMGEGTEQDVERGARYIEWAAEQNHYRAIEWLSELNYLREPAFAFRDQHDIDDWLNLSAPEQALIDSVLPLETFIDPDGLPGRHALTREHGNRTMDSRVVHYDCRKCKRTFAGPVRHIPKVPYSKWKQLVDWLHLLVYVDFGDLEGICSECGNECPCIFIDLHIFNSFIDQDLVLRVLCHEESDVPYAYKAFSWSWPEGYRRLNLEEDIDGHDLTVDAYSKRLATLLEFDGEDAMRAEVTRMASEEDTVVYLADLALDPAIQWLGGDIAHTIIDSWPEWSRGYSTLAAVCVRSMDNDQSNQVLQNQVKQLLECALSLDPEDPLARELWHYLNS